MIVFIYGTTAEAIKLAPIARRLDARGIPYEQWVTQQHTAALRAAMVELGLPAPDAVIADGWRGRPLKSPWQMLGWTMDVAWWTVRNLRRKRKSVPAHSVVLVHGDTVTTVLGAIIGRLMGLPVGHVEAGLRSGDWRNPFPEELDRRIVGRLARFHYAPSEEAVSNLGGRKNVVFTNGNTVVDAVRDSVGELQEAGDPYGLVLLHRFEFISNPSLVEETLRTIQDVSPLPMRIIVDAYSRDAVTAGIRDWELTKFTVESKQDHAAFVNTLRNAAFVITDSGGVQEESSVFGIPTLIHRRATERSEGLGSSAVLSEWNMATVRSFLEGWEELQAPERDEGASPSDIVVADLVSRGFGVRSDGSGS
jgi:UDP-N-acetylglucosamine 2-epimerase (non-hydrolysing)